MTIESVNPATEEVLARFSETPEPEIDAALSNVHEAFLGWRECSIADRGKSLHAAGDYLRRHRSRFAGLITSEMGKPIAESEAEVDKCAWNCDFYADQASQFLAPRPVETNARESYYQFQPLGVVLAVMPWNFPFWQVLRFAAPTLMAGNTAVLKHASNVPQCALAIEEIFRESGAFPLEVFRTLLVPSARVDALVQDERVAAVTLTGSEGAGSHVAATAGKALKKGVMELGGSDAFIVLEDADLNGAVEFAVRSRYQNAGQSCIAAKRFIVVEPVANEFEKAFAEAVAALPVGDPSSRETKVGPMARGDLRDDLDRQIQASLEAGARLVVGGKRREGRGYFYEPTVVADVRPGMPLFDEESFGPVAAVITVRDAEEAVGCANASRYGLGGNLWTRDVERGKALARRLESGSVFINGMTASDPRLPFGGVKKSGFGRELSTFGIHEFTNIQTVWIGPAGGDQTQSTATE